MTSFTVRRARTQDVPAIQGLMDPLVQKRILLGKNLVVLYESVREFRVAVDDAGVVVGCGALHVMWHDLGEVRSLAVRSDYARQGVGGAVLGALEDDARAVGISRLFCLTFEVDFFTKYGFSELKDDLLEPDVYSELLRSYDEGIAEFLDLARVKPNTLGNTRMLKRLETA